MTHATQLVPLQPRDVPPPVPPTRLEDFSVGDWLVQPSLSRLSRGDSVVHLRPQLMDVLECLVSGNGRTVTKQNVLNAVWSDRFVTETALARSVAELRQALDDDARHPRIIETIPKRGYRIIAPVVRGQALVATPTVAAPAPTLSSPTAAQPEPPVRPVDAGCGLPGADRPGWESAPAPWAVAAAVVLLIGVALLLAGWIPA